MGRLLVVLSASYTITHVYILYVLFCIERDLQESLLWVAYASQVLQHIHNLDIYYFIYKHTHLIHIYYTFIYMYHVAFQVRLHA